MQAPASAKQATTGEATAAWNWRAVRVSRENSGRVAGCANRDCPADRVRDALGAANVASLRAALDAADTTFIAIGDLLHCGHWANRGDGLIAGHVAFDVTRGVSRRHADRCRINASRRLATSRTATATAGFSQVGQRD